MSTLLLWLKNFYTTIGQYPTLYDFLSIAPEDITHLNHCLVYPMCETESFLTYSTTTTGVLGGGVSLHA